MSNLLKFPDGFLWGTSTSAHQVEGNNHNQWSKWEKENAERLSKEAKNHWQLWQREKFPGMFNPQNYISGRACDHYNRYEEDFDLAKAMNNNAHRFSIEWSRIEPEEGKFNQSEIEHYKNVVKALKMRNLEPFISLWHWTMPVWFTEKGGFAKKDNICSYFLVMRNLILAHQKVYKSIKKINPCIQVGIAKNNIYFEAHQNKFVNIFLKKIIEWWWNFYFLNQIKNHQDFIGLNHYFHNRINYGFNKNENKIVSDLGWELYPEAIYFTLKDLKKYNKPIYITENGLADATDKNREWFVKESLKNIHRAIH